MQSLIITIVQGLFATNRTRSSANACDTLYNWMHTIIVQVTADAQCKVLSYEIDMI